VGEGLIPKILVERKTEDAYQCTRFSSPLDADNDSKNGGKGDSKVFPNTKKPGGRVEPACVTGRWRRARGYSYFSLMQGPVEGKGDKILGSKKGVTTNWSTSLPRERKRFANPSADIPEMRSESQREKRLGTGREQKVVR